jgi:hypothetical protein
MMLTSIRLLLLCQEARLDICIGCREGLWLLGLGEKLVMGEV